jgi:hypothetical protein
MTTANVGDVDFEFYQAIDFGDLPDSYGTTVSAEGAGHISGTLFLGTALDTGATANPAALRRMTTNPIPTMKTGCSAEAATGTRAPPRPWTLRLLVTTAIWSTM